MITLERETLHLADGQETIALVETRTAGTDKAPAQLVRYQHGNHLGSAVLELDDGSNIISYEEYFPFGSTSYQAVTSQTDLPKRYRYTGKERDEENDLYYYGARYYLPWLGRWASCDPAGMTDGPSQYEYALDNPIRMRDPDGRKSQEKDDEGSRKPHAKPSSWKPGLSQGGTSRTLSFQEPSRVPAQDPSKGFPLQQPAVRDELKEPVLHSLVRQLRAAAETLYEHILSSLHTALTKTESETAAGPDQPDPVTTGIDTQVGASGVGVWGPDKAQRSFDVPQLTLLPRNLELFPLYFHNGWDIALLKEPGLQFELQWQRPFTGPLWRRLVVPGERHITIGETVDLLNVSRDPWEVALTYSAGYDIGHSLAVTGTLGAKYTLKEIDWERIEKFGTFKLRAYGGVTAEEDFPAAAAGLSRGFGGITFGAGVVLEYNPGEKKKK